MCGCAGVRVCGCADARVCGCAGVRARVQVADAGVGATQRIPGAKIQIPSPCSKKVIPGSVFWPWEAMEGPGRPCKAKKPCIEGF